LDLDHGRRWRMVSKKLAVGLAVFLPSANFSDEYTGADNAVEVGIKVLQGVLDDFETAPGLGVNVARRERAALFVAGSCTGHINMVASADGSALTAPTPKERGIPTSNKGCPPKQVLRLLG